MRTFLTPDRAARQRSGFILIVLIATVTVISILAAVALVSAQSAIDRVNQRAVQAAAVQFTRDFTGSVASGSDPTEALNAAASANAGTPVIVGTTATQAGPLRISTNSPGAPGSVAIGKGGAYAHITLTGDLTQKSGGDQGDDGVSRIIRTNVLDQGVSATEDPDVINPGQIVPAATDSKQALSSFMSRVGGAGSEAFAGASIAADGSVYLVGHFTGTASFGLHTVTSAGGFDGYIAKTDPAGRWQWVTTFTGQGLWSVPTHTGCSTAIQAKRGHLGPPQADATNYGF